MKRIYTKTMAHLCIVNAGKKYQPSNGVEGDLFIQSWCRECARDAALRECEGIDIADDDFRCEIVGKTMSLDVDDPAYPIQWQYGPDGQPRCLAFVPAGEPLPAERDPNTLDMFA